MSNPLNKYLESYGLKLKLKSNNENHLIDFENNFHRRNVGEIEVNKYTTFNSKLVRIYRYLMVIALIRHTYNLSLNLQIVEIKMCLTKIFNNIFDSKTFQ